MISPLSGRNEHSMRAIHHILAILRSTTRAARVDLQHHPASRFDVHGPADQPLRVLHIAESYSAGVASALDSYINATSGTVRHEILGFRRPGSQIGPPPERLFVDLPHGKLRQIASIRARLHTTDVDVIHVHSSWAGLFARATLRRSNRPIVFSPHCYACERADLRSGTRWLYRLAESLLAYRTDVVAAVGDHERSVATRLSPRVPVMPLAHSLSNEFRNRLELLAEQRRPGVELIATLARVAPQKGIDYFCSVVAATQRQAALAKIPAPRFMWIGGGDNKLTQQLAAAGVEVTGWLERSAAAALLAEADVYIHTAAWEAGWPLSLLEAAQLKRPILARRVSSTASLPEALLVDTPHEMARRIHTWRTRPAALNIAIAQVSCFANETAQPDHQRAALERLYQTALTTRFAQRHDLGEPPDQILRPVASQYGARS
jgi:glycosyltransferase involved in cell wall biosynthesis